MEVEILGGATTFMTMAYILFVNGLILSTAKLLPDQVLTVTALVAGPLAGRRVHPLIWCVAAAFALFFALS